ncbi:DegT/DnrJ/EryC1/StrS family aminotransferase, partial [Arthrobacter sp. TB 26]|uniref:DegT/DnrJ/EryC1/StrS family aminotransferase n=1 Tax=Arthrobacter sp. TB 26 TaxID=494420 RepID=UPI00178C36DC
PAYAGRDTGRADLSVTERLTDNTVILPVYHQLTLDDQARVIDSILKAAGESND